MALYCIIIILSLSYFSYSSSRRPITKKEAADRRRRELQKMLTEQSRRSPDSGYEEDKDLDPDYAEELMGEWYHDE